MILPKASLSRLILRVPKQEPAHLNHKQIDKLVNRHRFQPALIMTGIHDCLASVVWETARKIDSELFFQ